MLPADSNLTQHLSSETELPEYHMMKCEENYMRSHEPGGHAGSHHCLSTLLTMKQQAGDRLEG